MTPLNVGGPQQHAAGAHPIQINIISNFNFHCNHHSPDLANIMEDAKTLNDKLKIQSENLRQSYDEMQNKQDMPLML